MDFEDAIYLVTLLEFALKSLEKGKVINNE